MYSGDSPSAARPNHHQDLLTAAADEAAGYTSRSPHRSPSQSPRKMAGMGRTRSKLNPESRPASQQPYMAAEPRALRRTSSRSRISWLLCADWASALTVWGSDERFRTTVLVNLTGILERTDEQLLPAVYNFVAAAFDASPEQLGYLTLARALVQAAASPLGGILGHFHSRISVIAGGCLLWGIMTAGFSFCTSVQQGYLFWAVNGIGLAMVIPNGQSIIADSYPEASRGKAFGALYLTGAFGAMAGTLYATNMGCAAPFGIEGWRFSFLSVAVISSAIGALTYLFGEDPRAQRRAGAPPPAAEGSKGGATQQDFGSLMRETWSMCSVPTFLIIILQGILGSTPWNALVFLTLYFQLIGMSDFAASALMALFLGGTAFGGWIGGYVGDKAALWSPHHGRILACQLSVFAGVPLSLVILKGLPYSGDTGSVLLYATFLLTMGLLISWAAPACNNPIFAEIVPPHLRNMIYAFDRSFEMAIAACGAPLVGILAERVFGFTGKASTAVHCSDGVSAAETFQIEENHSKAHALGNALACSMVIPWALCAVLYTGLHWTYPKDKRKALAAAATETHANSAAGTRAPSEGLELGAVGARVGQVQSLDLEEAHLLRSHVSSS